MHSAVTEYQAYLIFLRKFRCLSNVYVREREREREREGIIFREIVQGYRTKLLRAPPGFLTCSLYSTITWFKVSSEQQLVIVRLPSPGIEPTTTSFQVECSINWSKNFVKSSRAVKRAHNGYTVLMIDVTSSLIRPSVNQE